MNERDPGGPGTIPPRRATEGDRRAQVTAALTLPPLNRAARIVAGIGAFLLGAALTAFFAWDPLGLELLPGRSEPVPGETAAAATEPAILWTCPMHPQVLEHEPGNCPLCGMKLVPAAGTGPSGEDHGAIVIDAAQSQNLGVVVEPARREDIARISRTVGILDFNADHITWVNTKFDGWIERVRVSYVGQYVKRGQALFEIYSPELVTTQEEYLRALEYRESLAASVRTETHRQAESLVESTRARLSHWDISDDQVEALERDRRVQRRVTVHSPVDGVVAEVIEQSLEGRFVKSGMNLYKIADLSTVWVHADVYESDLPWIREGQSATVTFSNDPGRSHEGTVLFLYPEVSRETRTLRICVEVPNRERRLRPGMYADVAIQGPPKHGAVVVPRSAVLRSGQRDLVFVEVGEGRFEPREVELGVSGEGERVEIVHGVAPGEAVVTQAQFMLDSESRIQEAIAKYVGRTRRGATDAPPGDTPDRGDKR